MMIEPRMDARGGLDAYFRDETVPLADHCADKARVPGIVPEDGAQFVYRSVDAGAGVDKNIVSPQPLIDDIAADHLAGMLE